jgi:peptidyl-prolyl cis-trans isomerase SurA
MSPGRFRNIGAVKKLLCFFAVVASLLQGRNARAEVVNGVAVVVCDSVITLGEIKSEVAERAPGAGTDRARYEQQLQKLYDQAMERRVEEKLILHDFVSSGYLTNVLEAFIDDEIRREIKKNYGGDRAVFDKTLEAKGQTYEMYRRQEREDFIIRAMNYQNSSNPHKIIISPLKIEQYYQTNKDEFKVEDEVKLRMIVIPQSADDAPGTAKALAEEILAKINSGVPFAEMAKVNSAGLQRTEGGDRGWVNHSLFKAALADVAFSLKPGQRSGVIELPEACYLLQVDDVRPAHIRDLKEVRAEIERTLTSKENLRLRELWIQRLKNKSYVQYY